MLPLALHSPDFWLHLAAQPIRTEGSGGSMGAVFKGVKPQGLKLTTHF